MTRSEQALARLMLRTERGPLRPLWAAIHASAIRIVAAYLRRGLAADVYLKGGFGFAERIYGVSDVDMFVVVKGDPAHLDSLRVRLERLRRALPLFAKVFQVWIYTDARLEALRARSFLTQSWAGDLTPDELALAERPGLYGATRDWRRLGASRSHRPEPVRDPAERRIYAWQELQTWWMWTLRASFMEPSPAAGYLRAKLVAEPARIWLWLARGEQTFGRREALVRARDLLPEETDAFDRALWLLRNLARATDVSLADVVPPLLRLSQRIARVLGDETKDAGHTQVRLVWNRDDELVLEPEARRSFSRRQPAELLPLCDWRARVLPEPPDQAFAVVAGDPADVETLRRSAATRWRIYAALRASELLVFPAADPWHLGRFRIVQCPVSDPVSFALADGLPAARFPDVPGFSAEDSARRAVDEHRARLLIGRGDELDALFTGARAALFHDSVNRGEPELLLTAAAVAHALDAESALTALRELRVHRLEPAENEVAAFRRLVTPLLAPT